MALHRLSWVHTHRSNPLVSVLVMGLVTEMVSVLGLAKYMQMETAETATSLVCAVQMETATYQETVSVPAWCLGKQGRDIHRYVCEWFVHSSHTLPTALLCK